MPRVYQNKYSVKIGEKYGRLKVIGPTFRTVLISSDLIRVCVCLCKCGDYCVKRVDCLVRKLVGSCGCKRRETSSRMMREMSYSHGLSYDPIYRVWWGMLARCENPGNDNYRFYGGRGITVCSEWHNLKTFSRWAKRNGWLEGLEIDREDTYGNYCPENCRFITHKNNTRNRTNTVYIEAFGEVKMLTEWLEDSRCRVKEGTLRFRLRRSARKWTSEQAISTSPTK